MVIRTGNNTFIGSIAANVSGTDTETSNLKREIDHVVKFITKLAIAMGVIFFIIGVARGLDPLYVFINGFIIVVVANVPEGLPTTLTSILTVIARRLGERSVYIKKLECLETLGSTTVIASDKTGTIT
jgi:sodium/potassium-transporting ATPase subunit alpha